MPNIKSFMSVLSAICVFAFVGFSFNAALAQTPYNKIQSYIDSGGLRNFEIDNTDDDIEEVLRSLESQKGALIDSQFTFYTESHSFNGTLIQTTSQYYVIAEIERVNAQNTYIKKLHILDRSDVIGVTANFRN